MLKSTNCSAKKTYRQPSLVRYGSIAKLTHNGNGSGLDGSGIGGMTKGNPPMGMGMGM